MKRARLVTIVYDIRIKINSRRYYCSSRAETDLDRSGVRNLQQVVGLGHEPLSKPELRFKRINIIEEM